VCRVAQDETAFSFREAAGYYFWTDTFWQDAAEVNSSLAWVSSFWDAMQPFASGAVHVNELCDEGEEWVEAVYGANYARLVTLKNRYDPINFFRMNQNIKPAA
jgi:FAD/FMN-containing dehydrogenase